MRQRSKRYQESVKMYNGQEKFNINDAVKLIKDFKPAKFDETVEISIKLNLKKGVTIRDTIVLPNSFGKEKKILVFAKGEAAEVAKSEGAAFVGDVDLVEKIKGGWVDFDVAVATPDMMKDVGKLGPILGRRGLMPNPKTGTVTKDIKAAIAELKKGRVEYRADKTGVLHLGIGKVSFDSDKIIENSKAFYQEVMRKKPQDQKGEFVRSVHLSATMGPGVEIDYKNIN